MKHKSMQSTHEFMNVKNANTHKECGGCAGEAEHRATSCSIPNRNRWPLYKM